MSSSLTSSNNGIALVSEHVLSLVGPISRSTLSLPLNRIRILLQTTTKTTTKTNTKTTTTTSIQDNCSSSTTPIEYGKKIIREEGIIGLWKGYNVQLVNVLLVRYTTIPITRFITSFHTLSSPLIASLVNSLLSYPLEQCKTILVADREKKYTGMIDYFKQRNIESHYHGFLAFFLGALVYRKSLSFIYTFTQSFRPYFLENLPEWGVVLAEVAISQLCIAGASAIAYPLDTVSRRLQLQSCKKSNDEKSSNNTIQCAKKIIKEEGVLALYGGFGTHCLSAFSLTLLSLTLHAIIGQ